ncbi:unnamed protein product [Brugia pahangi]|uniref:Uncharacterized protein n=1 Tax=Brugia pahangi TaxID=6280 RepID=A0A0N4TQN8_BRUPA|nr:unnamed protein product [Brugia pahangi]
MIKRSRTHLAMRFMFRVNPCFYCFGFQCVFALLLIILIALFCKSVSFKIDEFSRLLRENQILNEKKNVLPFIECTYKKTPEFSTVRILYYYDILYSSCGEDDDLYAFISRFYESTSANSQCVNRVDLLPCLSTDNALKFNHTMLENFPQCAGLNKIRLKNYITQSTAIVAPSINITKYHYKILRPKDFLVKCPICAIKSFFGWRETYDKNIGEWRNCARELKTYTRGWPQHARYCDFEDEHDEADFCRLHELLREKLGIKMDESNELDFIDSSDSRKLSRGQTASTINSH